MTEQDEIPNGIKPEPGSNMEYISTSNFIKDRHTDTVYRVLKYLAVVIQCIMTIIVIVYTLIDGSYDGYMHWSLILSILVTMVGISYIDNYMKSD